MICPVAVEGCIWGLPYHLANERLEWAILFYFLPEFLNRFLAVFGIQDLF